MIDTKTIFPKRLKDLRKKKGLSQRDLSELSHISFQAISTYEKKLSSSLPSCDALARLADALDTSSDYLIGLTDVESNDIDAIKASKYLGMCESVINTFKRYQKHTDNIKITKSQIIEMFLKDPSFLIVVDRCCALRNHRDGNFDMTPLEESVYYNEAISLITKVITDNFFNIETDQFKSKNLNEGKMLLPNEED